MKFYGLLLLLFIGNFVCAQDKDSSISSKEFFSDDRPIDATISTDLATLLSNKGSTAFYDAVLTFKFPDNTVVSEPIKMNKRGHYRRQNCYVPPIKVNFKSTPASKLSSLKSLKLINGCNTGNFNDQLILKEYLVYKIYNLLSDKSFRVRLLNLKYEDSKGKKKTMAMHSFLLEDIDVVAKRNKCKKMEETANVRTEACNREHITFVSIFEYMIGNTDWAIPVAHNIRLLRPKDDSLARPYAVPYDFDYSGLVNANYAVPDERLGTTTVLERVYRGFPRNLEELKVELQPFRDQKEKIYSLIKNFEPLSSANKNEMINYLDQFYSNIRTDYDVKRAFIDNARVE